MTKRERRTYTPEFKEQMVKLYESGKSKNDILKQAETTMAQGKSKLSLKKQDI